MICVKTLNTYYFKYLNTETALYVDVLTLFKSLYAGIDEAKEKNYEFAIQPHPYIFVSVHKDVEWPGVKPNYRARREI